MHNFHVFDVRFINGDYSQAFSRLQKGQFMVVPSGPGLSTIDKDTKYWKSLKGADFAIPDSGFMIILLRLFFNFKIRKLSGPKFFRKFVDEKILTEEGMIFSIDPNEHESNINREYLNQKGIPITSEYQYTAPLYNKVDIIDPKLINILESLKIKPNFLLLNLGGGVQERLGLYIKNNLSYSPAIICSGAAIAFETGSQAKLPKWADDFYLGWLARVIQSPRQFAIRFLKAFRLVYVVYLYKINKL